MYYNYKTIFEWLPDELILEMCRYLHCSHVLYSFFDLNTRLNQTITSYRKHIWFRRSSYKQLLHIYSSILPRIGSSVLSITIHPLHQASFPSSFNEQMSNIFPNLESLTLTSWTSEKLFPFICDTIQNMKYLKKVVIQELYPSSTIPDSDFIEKVFNVNTKSLTNIIFDYDCNSFKLRNYSFKNIISYHILDLTIQLDTLEDFSSVINCIPNIHRLDITLRESSLEKVPFHTTLPFLTEFSIWAIHWYSRFHDLKPLLTIAPAIEQFSLTLSTRDFDLMNGDKVLSVLPSQLKQFNYTVNYHPNDSNGQFNIDRINQSWKSMPIIYSITESDKRIFLHTLPYSATRLTIRSSLGKNMPVKNIYQIYSKIDQIQVYSMTNLADTFAILGQCRRVRELSLLVANESTTPTTSSTDNKKSPVQLPYLGRLDILTIEGIPSDLYNLKNLLVAAPNLSILVIDLDCLLMSLEDENESLSLYFLLHRQILDLCIRVSENSTKKAKITTEQIHLIARIFTRIRNLTIDYDTSDEYVDSNIIKFIINEFQQLVIFHIYGKIPNDIPINNIRPWFIEQNPFRIKPTDIFRVECNTAWFKLWL